MVLFFVGIIEMVVVTAWTQVVTKTKIVTSGVMTMVNIFIWYYVLQSILENINNIGLVALYACGCAVGTMLTTLFFSQKNKRAAASASTH